MLRRTLLLTFAALLVSAAPAAASDLIDRNATGVKFAVNAKGEALLTYKVNGATRRVLAWGGVNAIAPTQSRRQISFKLDYSGGWGKYKSKVWIGFKNTCGRYRGPALQWLVTACTARDGSHWAIQSWQRMLPNYGLNPNAKQAVWELRLSHWTGDLAQLDINLDWSYAGRFDHLWGRYTYRGQGVYGFKATSVGNPLDTFGRNVYVDTLDSTYGKGWKRENSFLAHKGSGTFCYGFYLQRPPLTGTGKRYRATVIGPGVTPDVYWESAGPGAYDRAADAVANEEQRTFFPAGSSCKIN